MKKFNSIILVLATFILVTLCGCSLTESQKPYPPAAPVVSLFLHPVNYPEKFKMIHRCTLVIKGRSMVFNGYILVDRLQNTIKCVAQTDMGATLFKYIYKDGNLTISYCSPGLKPDWIENYVLRDTTLLYLFRSSATLSQGTTQESIHNNSRLIGYLIQKNGKEIYRADFTYSEKTFEKFSEKLIPDTITIKDKTLNYSLFIRVMEFTCIEEKDF